MRGASIWFIHEDNEWVEKTEKGEIDLIFCCDMMSVADLRALLPPKARRIPIVCYFHENQLTYPLSRDDERDYQYGMTNITSCLAADAVWFNSAYHRDAFISAVNHLMKKMPDHVPSSLPNRIQNKSFIHYPPVSVVCDSDCDEDGRAVPRPAGSAKNSVESRDCSTKRLRILWSHRWEYDKNPEPFFDALMNLIEDGFDFELVCLGEQFRTAPKVFEKVWYKLQKYIVHAGFLPSREEYLENIKHCDIVVSTAIQENFGIAMVEAVMLGCQPLLPDRLAYPEIIPQEFHTPCLYQNDSELLLRLKNLIQGQSWLSDCAMVDLQGSMMKRFGVEQTVRVMDHELRQLVDRVCL